MPKHRSAVLMAGGALAAMSLLGNGTAALAATATCTPAASRICVLEQPSISAQNVVVGETVKAQSGTQKFDPGSLVGVTVASKTYDLGTVTADSNGMATITFKVPALPLGTHHVIFKGSLAGLSNSVSIAFTVVPPTVPGGLPRTGSSTVIPFTEAGLGLIVVGASVLLFVRRRRTVGGLAA